LLLSHFSPDDTRLAELLLVVLDEDHVALALFLLTSHLSHDDVRPGLLPLPVLLPAGVRWPDDDPDDDTGLAGFTALCASC
jgi:hypothetical protein